ncbi:MAG: site-specific DNA-methyltransferase [Candidatus Riflebacteria bacterium HGW-Riflebacteria-1]|jgi:adenine-specific DNA-methyltransferase|nr:MAG: site-specific DNA-methyltransferase [Candidatus Riflebacteria bacterium HGW-Riflebacteria-1]
MPSVEQLRGRLFKKLKELFQLDQPDLDFGFYRIMHAKAKQVQEFLEKDLLKIVSDAFSEVDEAKCASYKADYEKALKMASDFGAPDPANTPAVMDAKQKWNSVKDSSAGEAEVYDHLYHFFERYYDDGDFISRRYFARETADRAAPFSIPYSGEEVKLHWANSDQYYIKTAEYFSNFTFDLVQSAEVQSMNKSERILRRIPDRPMKVHLRIVAASEGEHGNVKANSQSKRFFIIHKNNPVELDKNGELILNFEYRSDLEKGSVQEGIWRETRNAEAVALVLQHLEALIKSDKVHRDYLSDYQLLLQQAAPTEKNSKRILLSKYVAQYTDRNTMDYFIHKDLGSFLRRELDFYIKNEIMRLDDIENAEAPAVETYLKKIRVMRKIAVKLIDFLAQLEDFQKKLWLKKKFVIETNYCITLDRVPEELYPDIIKNEEQHNEWVELFSINELKATKGDLLNPGSPGYSKPLKIEFLKANNKLVLDTRLFDENFKASLMASIEDLDEQFDGLLIHSENFQALSLLQARYRSHVKCVYIDPPYNTGSSDFCYKDAFRNSSWLSMLQDRIVLAVNMLPEDGVLFVHIDDKDEDNFVSHRLMNMIEDVFGSNNYLDNLIWVKNTTHNDAKTFSHNHEYILAFAKNREIAAQTHSMFRQAKPGCSEVMELVHLLNHDFPSIEEIQKQMKDLFKQQLEAYKQEVLSHGLEWDDETKKNDPWKGIKQYKLAEYRDSDGNFVEESLAKNCCAKIVVFREDNPSWPNASSLTSEHKSESSQEYRFYKPLHPLTGRPCPAPARGWLWREKINPDKPKTLSFEEMLKKNYIYFGEDENKIPQVKRFLHNVESDVVKSVISDFTDGEKELANILGERGLFPNPKPTSIGKKLIEISTSQGDTVLDFFAGSGSSVHALMQQNFIDEKARRFVAIELGDHFDSILIKRVKKALYSVLWKDGRASKEPSNLHCFKYLRLESYEDTLNNLQFDADKKHKKLLESKPGLKEDFMLRYLLDVETRGSQSLVNINAFADPTAYTLAVKKPGSDETVTRNVDLIETFNFLIGLRVNHIASPQNISADFKRIEDPELPKDQNTRLVVDGKIHNMIKGPWWFRKVEGWVPADPMNPNNGQREKVLIVWRKLTGDLEQDNLVLDEWFKKNRISSRDFEFDLIYVNGSNNLPNLKLEGDNWKVRLIEEEFMTRMWEAE